MNRTAESLFTDLYQLTMMEAYHREKMNGVAVFEFFVRRLPPSRSFLVACGLEQVLTTLSELRFERAELDYLESLKIFSRDFLTSLGDFRFTGDVNAMAEGTIFFENEPVVQIVAPIPQAQFVETRILNIVHGQTVFASKAAKVRKSAQNKFLVDFGCRRAHGREAGMWAARSSYIAGFDGTSLVEANARFGIPVFGTMAHSYVEAHDSEISAFENFAATFPAGTTLLIDTYDTENGARMAVKTLKWLQDRGASGISVRLDSGDLAQHAAKVRAILDGAGLNQVRIFASGGLDENEIEALLQNRAPIDGFGVGTSLATSGDAPSLDSAYKLQEYEGRPRRKFSEGKKNWPGRKQVFRRFDADGRIQSDLLALAGETAAGEPLLQNFMRGGLPTQSPEPLAAARSRLADALQRLPAKGRVPVSVSTGLNALTLAMEREGH